MELDKSKKKADMQGHTTRADGVRLHLFYVDIHFVCVCVSCSMKVTVAVEFDAEPQW